MTADCSHCAWLKKYDDTLPPEDIAYFHQVSHDRHDLAFNDPIFSRMIADLVEVAS